MLRDKKLFLFDIDGTIAVGDRLYEGSRELLDYIERNGGKIFYITNNSTKSGSDYVEKFRSCFQLTAANEQFITSGYMTLQFLLDQYRDKKIYVMGTASFLQELRKNGLHITEKAEPDIACIVVAYDSELTYAKLTETCRALTLTKAPFYATNPDLCCPIDFGYVPDCGSICKMLEASTHRTPIYLGKPNPAMVKLCMERSGFSPEQTLVIGDRLYTDIACGIHANVDTCVVLTGEASREDLKNTEFPPTFCFPSVTELYKNLLL